MFSCKTCIDLYITGWVESTTQSAGRFVGAVAYSTFRARCLTLTTAVAWLSTPATDLYFCARERFMSEAQTPEALHWSLLGLEDPGEGRFSVYKEVLAFQQLCCVCTLGHVHDHRPVRLRQILSAEPRNPRNLHLVFLFNISTIPVRSSSNSSKTAVRHAISTLTGTTGPVARAFPPLWSFPLPPSPTQARFRLDK